MASPAPTNDQLAELAREIVADAIRNKLNDRMVLAEELHDHDHLNGLDETECEALIDRLENAIRWEAREFVPLTDAK